MCGRVIQSSAPIRYGIVEGMDVRDSRVHNYPPRWNGAPSHVGVVFAETLRSLTCSACGASRYVEGGQRIVNKIAFQEWLLGEHEAPRAQSR